MSRRGLRSIIARVQILRLILPIALELGIVAGFALLFTTLSIRGFGKPE